MSRKPQATMTKTDISATGGTAGTSAVHTIDRVLLEDWLEIEFTSKTGRPVLSGIELRRLEE